MQELKIKLYRHKIYKDIYLARRWSICGGSPDTDFFYATNNLQTALENTLKGDMEIEYTKFWYEKGHSRLKAKIVLEKDMEFDGYKGTMKKELELPLDDFELITLQEK